ncbi:MAG: SDR family oxidoreductase [Clostridiaceae bacterium]|nr:SDR family oxidoreductase [Clostridiaceae bacterium]
MKTALITGASSGIGRELALLLAAHYDRIVLTARSKSKLEELATAIASTSCEAYSIPIDLSREGAAAELYHRLETDDIEVDLLINNAGSGLTGPFLSHDISSDHTTIDLNITALTDLCRLIGSKMQARGSGHILNVASTGAFQPGSYIAVYYASKAYVYSFSLALADELRDSGVSVSVLCPGATATNFSASSGKADIANAMTAAQVAQAAWQGIQRKKVVIIPGTGNKIAVMFSKIMPDRMMTSIVRRIQKKQYELYRSGRS